MEFAPPVNREITAADYEYAIERAAAAGRGERLRRLYIADIVGFEEAQSRQPQDDPTGGAPDIEGVTATDDYDAGDRARRADAPTSSSRRCRCRSRRRCPRSTRRSSTRRTRRHTATTSCLSGPYMVENDAEGELTGYTPGREIKHGPQPELGRRSRTSGPRTSTRSRSRKGSTTRRPQRARCSRRGQRSAATSCRRRTSLKDAADERRAGQLTLTPSGGNRYIGLNTQAAAVRRPRRPQGRHRDRRPRGAAQHARRRADRTGRDAHHPAASSRASRRPAGRGRPRAGLPRGPERGPGAGRRVHEGSRITRAASAKAPTARSRWSATTSRRARTRPRCSGARTSRISASTSTFRPVDHDDHVHAVLQHSGSAA